MISTSKVEQLHQLVISESVDEVLALASGPAAWWFAHRVCNRAMWPLMSSPGRRLSNPQFEIEIKGQTVTAGRMGPRGWLEVVYSAPRVRNGTLFDFSFNGVPSSERMVVLQAEDPDCHWSAVAQSPNGSVIVGDWPKLLSGWADLGRCRVSRTVDVQGALIGSDGQRVECGGDMLTTPGREKVLHMEAIGWFPTVAPLRLELADPVWPCRSFVASQRPLMAGPHRDA